MAWLRGVHHKTVDLLVDIKEVLLEYRAHLPLTIRQAFYRLVGAHGYEKTDKLYRRVSVATARARRAAFIPFSAIRDDGVIAHIPSGFDSTDAFWRTVTRSASRYRRNRMADQPVAVEVWCESAGMAPQLARVGDHYGVPVYSSGGFDSVTLKHEAAQRILAYDRDVFVGHVGDLDEAGGHIYTVLSEDVLAFLDDLGFRHKCQFVRVAVTPEQGDFSDGAQRVAKHLLNAAMLAGVASSGCTSPELAHAALGEVWWDNPDGALNLYRALREDAQVRLRRDSHHQLPPTWTVRQRLEEEMP